MGEANSCRKNHLLTDRRVFPIIYLNSANQECQRADELVQSRPLPRMARVKTYREILTLLAGLPQKHTHDS